MMAVVCQAQNNDPGWFVAPDGNIDSSGLAVLEVQPTNQSQVQPLGLGSPPPAIAEAITPDIQALADNLQDNWSNIFYYVNSNIRYSLYYGSKKGAELTLLEKSGNDFDQCALTVALLNAAGYANVNYQFGWEGVPYDDPSGHNHDLHHWLGLGFSNTNWLYTSNYVSHLFSRRFYSTLDTTGDTNTFVFQRVWVTFTASANTYWIDPAFKTTAPISGISLTNAMNFSSNSLMSTASVGSTDTGNYVSGVNEANIKNALTSYTTNLLNYVQSNYPNASVQQILGGQKIVPSLIYNEVPTSFGISIAPPYFNTYTVTSATGYADGTVNWAYEPTNLMSAFTVTFAGTNWQCWVPQLQGQRLSLTYDTNGLAQLWLGDSNVVQNSTSVSSTNVALDINQPVGIWDFTNNAMIRLPFEADNNVTNVYQRTNSSYALLYAFEPDWGWLQKRQNQLDSYLQQGLPGTSRQVVSETLNIMGLNWMLETEGTEQMLANQEGILPQYHYRLGRMAQEAGRGYYVDIYMQLSGEVSSSGSDTNNLDLEHRHGDLTSYFFSALESGLIEQMQSSNITAASTVKMLEIGNWPCLGSVDYQSVSV